MRDLLRRHGLESVAREARERDDLLPDACFELILALERAGLPGDGPAVLLDPQAGPGPTPIRPHLVHPPVRLNP